MLFDVYPLRRNGVPVPLWQRSSTRRRGTVKVFERPDHTLGRSIKVAELMAGEDVPTLPPLRDVVLVATDGRRWTLTGYEEVLSIGAAHPVHYQQSWMLIPAEELDREEELDRQWREASKNAPPPPETPRQAKRKHRASR